MKNVLLLNKLLALLELFRNAVIPYMQPPPVTQERAGAGGVSLEQMVGHVPGHPGLLPRLVPAYPAGTGPNA